MPRAGLVAVTGATGFVGLHLIAALARHGWRLRLLVRRWSPLPSLAGVDAEIVWGDLDDEEAVAALVNGADAVVHAAGLIKALHPADFMRVNRDGTARLSALSPNVRLVLLSSLAAREPELSPYGASKRAAEQALESRTGPWLAVRAPAVYGPGDRETLAYFRLAERGFAPRPMVPGARLGLIHVADLAEVLALVLDGALFDSICEIDDGRDGGYSYDDMAAAAGTALGRPVRGVSIPKAVMLAVAGWNRAQQILTQRPEILLAGKVREIFHTDWTAHDRRLANSLGFRPKYDLTEGFRDTVLWYRSQGWLRKS